MNTSLYSVCSYTYMNFDLSALSILKSGPLSAYVVSFGSLCMTKAVHRINCVADCLLYNVPESKVRLEGSDLCCAAGLAVFVAAEVLL